MKTELTPIENIILEEVWISRWNEDKTSLTAILTDDEALNITKNIVTSLKSNGYIITKLSLFRQIIDKLFCYHEWKEFHRIHIKTDPDQAYPDGVVFIFKCEKCGKFKKVKLKF